MADLSTLKRDAGRHAADMVQSGMLVGLGTGSTAYFAIERIAERLRDEAGFSVKAVSTSFSTTLLCEKMGIPLLNVGSVSALDVAIDGADEIDPARNLIKGRGAAHLIEKIVARMAKKFVVVADETKRVKTLGASMPVPIEVHPLALASLTKQVMDLTGAERVEVRMAGKSKDGPVISDSGNLIVDAWISGIEDPKALAETLDALPGCVGHGVFAGLCSQVILATSEGLVEF
ncbi:MAG: ribose-5-phosphate isomerase RpiA [Fibrobacterales bacterium]|nr:ribose-5-phosphate isomerase RpiA [Fibrobacterales bacterium]MBP5188547.1 ribose-5-phosphate isomerase RpiA [Fibrobacterales bacterium]